MSGSKRRPLRRPRIVIELSELARLMDLADSARESIPGVGEFLTEELSRSFVVPDGTCASNVVRMGSRVTYREDFKARVRHVTLTYPHQADIDRGRLSMLTPIGAALIGMSIAQTIEWPTPDGSIEEARVEETAQALGVPEATVRSRYFRAKSLLRESLAREFDLAERDIYEFGGVRCDRVVERVMSAI